MRRLKLVNGKPVEGEVAPTLFDLPVEAQANVLSFLKGPEIVKFAQTCNAAHALLQYRYLWRQVIDRSFHPMCRQLNNRDVEMAPTLTQFKVLYTRHQGRAAMQWRDGEDSNLADMQARRKASAHYSWFTDILPLSIFRNIAESELPQLAWTVRGILLLASLCCVLLFPGAVLRGVKAYATTILMLLLYAVHALLHAAFIFMIFATIVAQRVAITETFGLRLIAWLYSVWDDWTRVQRRVFGAIAAVSVQLLQCMMSMRWYPSPYIGAILLIATLLGKLLMWLSCVGLFLGIMGRLVRDLRNTRRPTECFFKILLFTAAAVLLQGMAIFVYWYMGWLVPPFALFWALWIAAKVLMHVAFYGGFLVAIADIVGQCLRRQRLQSRHSMELLLGLIGGVVFRAFGLPHVEWWDCLTAVGSVLLHIARIGMVGLCGAVILSRSGGAANPNFNARRARQIVLTVVGCTLAEVVVESITDLSTSNLLLSWLSGRSGCF